VAKDPIKQAPDFTDSDQEALEYARAMLQEQQHRRWLVATAGRIVKWVLAFIAGTTLVSDAAMRIWRAIHGP
jgi:hypothetical protein